MLETRIWADGICGYAVIVFPDKDDGNILEVIGIYGHKEQQKAEDYWREQVKKMPCRLIALLEVEE